MVEPIPHLATLRAAAEAAGPEAARALIDLLQDYVRLNDEAYAIQAKATQVADAAAAVDAGRAELEALIQQYRAHGAALVLCLRERQRRDPTRVSPDLRGLLRAETAAIGAFHTHDHAAVLGPLWGMCTREGREVGHA